MNDEKTEDEPLVPEITKKLIPPVYSRQLILFGLVVFSDTRKLDEDALYDRIASRIDKDLAKEIMTLKSKR